MGQLHYGAPATSFEFDDRTLAHLELVVLAKLRRNESFAFTVEGPKKARQTVWISASATLRFEFGSTVTDINRDWLDELIDSANTTSGMRVVPEPEKIATP